LLTKLVSGDT